MSEATLNLDAPRRNLFDVLGEVLKEVIHLAIPAAFRWVRKRLSNRKQGKRVTIKVPTARATAQALPPEVLAVAPAAQMLNAGTACRIVISQPKRWTRESTASLRRR